jgi:hypothetical protein
MMNDFRQRVADTTQFVTERDKLCRSDAAAQLLERLSEIRRDKVRPVEIRALDSVEHIDIESIYSLPETLELRRRDGGSQNTVSKHE